MKKLLLVFTLFMIVSMLLASCGGGGGAKVIKIATQSPLSGNLSAVGVDMKNLHHPDGV